MMIKKEKIKKIVGFTLFLAFYTCTQLNTKKNIENKLVPNCSEILKSIENNLFLSCPISKSPDSVITFLSNQSTFIRNKEYDFGNGSVRFNAKNASFLQCKLIDEKSLFLLNYFTNENGKSTFSHFQAIYYFNNENDKNQIYDKMIEFLDNKLKLIPKVMTTINNQPYLRYHLPCGSGFNIKQTKNLTDKFVIDILWVPDVSK